MAREVISKMNGVESVVVDTTARAVVRMKKNKKLGQKAVEAVLSKKRMAVTSLKAQSIPKAVEVYEIVLEGLG